MSIPYSKQNIHNSDFNIIKKTLKNEFLTGGIMVKNFETKIEKFIGTKFSITMNSATSCLLAACYALKLKKNDNVWVTTNSFVSSANCANFFGAKLDFLDIDRNNYNIDLTKLELKLKTTKKKDLPKILIIVHIGGYPCDLNKIYNLKKKYRFKIIEDASHAFGAEYNNKKIGSFVKSDVTVFSFHPVKIITTAEGGCCVTHSKILSDKLKRFRDNGIIRNVKTKKFYFKNYYEMPEPGLNLRLNDIQCALGISQLDRIKKNLIYRKELANYYFKKLIKIRLNLPFNDLGFSSSYHLFIIQFIEGNKENYKKIMQFFYKNGIKINTHYFPIHLQPYYKKIKKFNLPESIDYYFKSFSIPLYYGLEKSKQDKVIEVIKKISEQKFLKKKNFCYLKKASQNDSKYVFDLQNKDLNRKFFFNNKKLIFNNHNKWFKEKLLDKNTFLHCIYEADKRCGFVGLHIVKKKTLVPSIIVDKKFRKKGYAYDALFEAFNSDKFNGYKILTYCNINNPSSIKLFQRLGFIITKTAKNFITLKRQN
tara:strand:- start:19 stop:1626 length:1608 start_codon:yes stop_codon:yes gene_type:complete